jgi:peptidoglycan glycosyltransferase
MLRNAAPGAFGSSEATMTRALRFFSSRLWVTALLVLFGATSAEARPRARHRAPAKLTKVQRHKKVVAIKERVRQRHEAPKKKRSRLTRALSRLERLRSRIVPVDAPTPVVRHVTVERPEAVPLAPATPVLGQGRELGALLASARWNTERGAYMSRMADGREAQLTLDRDLQTDVERELSKYSMPYASVVAMDPRDGRVLTVAERGNEPAGTAVRAIFPAASVFKIVTGAALLEAGIAPESEACFHGGSHAIQLDQLTDNPRRDHRCESLSTAMGKSINLVFGKFASRTLDAATLQATAERFFFNQPLPLVPAAAQQPFVSPAEIPSDALGFGRTAAGFGKVYLSPMHGALLAGTVGNRGVAVEPRLVETFFQGGRRTPAPAPRETRVVSEATSAMLTTMMQRTVSEGTARKAFHRGGAGVLTGIAVAGKTGSLADHPPLPFKDYSWFVGFAPAEKPRVAVAVVVVNGHRWQVKAAALAKETLQSYFKNEIVKSRRASNE